MCSTCNYQRYEQINEETLAENLGTDGLQIQYDLKGKKYKLAIKDESKSGFVIYRCPTCGRKLF